MPDRPAAVQGGHAGGDAAPGAVYGGGAAHAAVAQSAPRSGDDLPEVPGEGTTQALPLGRGTSGRLASLPGRRADPGAAGVRGRARLAVVPPQSRCSFPGGLGGATAAAGRRWHFGDSGPARGAAEQVAKGGTRTDRRTDPVERRRSPRRTGDGGGRAKLQGTGINPTCIHVARK